MSEHGVSRLDSLSISQKLKDVTYLTFLLVGIGLLWPWNNILSATLYFQDNIFRHDTLYAKIFTSSMMTVSTVTSLFFNVYLSKRQHSYGERVTRGLVWQIISFIVLTLVSFITSQGNEDWLPPLWFTFFLIMCLVGISAISTALTQNGIMAIANVFGAEYSQTVMVGQAIAGVLPSLVLFFVSFMSSTNNGGGSEEGGSHGDATNESGILFYFMTTALVCLGCIVLYKMSEIGEKLTKITNGRNDATTANDDHVSHEHVTLLEEDGKPGRKIEVPLLILFNKLKYLVLSIFTTFVVTLVFPVFASQVKVSKFPLQNTQFIPLVFTVWNLGDLYGRVIADLPIFRNPNFTPRKTFIYSLLRMLMVPFFFYFTTRSIHESQSIWLDINYIILQFLFGVTNGHVISISFMKVPEQLDSDNEKEAAGGFTNIFVSTGLAAGSLISYLFVALISSIN